MKENHTEDSDQNEISVYQGADPPTGERKDA